MKSFLKKSNVLNLKNYYMFQKNVFSTFINTNKLQY